MRTNRLTIVIFIIITICFLTLEYLAAKTESLTWDETGHHTEGVEALINDNFTISPNSPTFVPQLLALPTVFGLDEKIENLAFPSDQRLLSRMTSASLTVLTALLLFTFVAEIGSKTAALFAVLAFYFEPHVFAHAHYITLDSGFTLLFFLSWYLFYKLTCRQDLLTLVLSGFFTGLMISAKATGIGFFLLSVGLYWIMSRGLKYPSLSYKKLLLFLGLTLFGIWFTYRFTWGTLGGYTAGGNRFSNKLEQVLLADFPAAKPWIKTILTSPLPLGDFPRILKNAYIFNQSPKYSFFLGSRRHAQGFYFVILYLLKTPLPLVTALFLYPFVVKRKREIAFVIAPVIAMLFFVSVSNIDLRLRYLLPAYPFLAVLAGNTWFSLVKSKHTFWIGISFVVWFLINFASSFPHTISYVNEISGLINKPYLLISDSNLDWGQGLIDLNAYVQEKDISRLSLSYYGIDDPNQYGFTGFAKHNICKISCTIEETNTPVKNGISATAISVTNWHDCLWYQSQEYSPKNIKDVVAGSLLIF